LAGRRFFAKELDLFRWVQVAKYLHISLSEWLTMNELMKDAVFAAFEWLSEKEQELLEEADQS